MRTEDVTLSEVSEQWMKTKLHSIKASTAARYFFLLDRHILPGLGDYQLKEIDEEVISEFLQLKQLQGNLRDGSPLSSKTICDIRTLLLEIMKYARRKGLSDLYLDDIYYPRSDEKLITVLSIEEQRRLNQYLAQHNSSTELGITLSLYGGLRIGEVCALTWDDINMTRHSITVSKTLNRIITTNKDKNDAPRTVIQVTSPKTQHSRREIPMAESLYNTLCHYREEWNDMAGHYVLTGTTKPIEPRLLLKHYKALLKQIGLPDYTFHTLRHTFATRCVEVGMDAKTLSMILGHSNVSITLQRYVHPSFDQEARELQKLETFLKVHTLRTE